MRGIEASTAGSGVSFAEPPVSTALTAESGDQGAGLVRCICACTLDARNTNAANDAAARSTVGRDMADERNTAARGPPARPRDFLLLLRRFVPELLPADARFVHQSALGRGEHRHALLVAARGLRVLGTRARARTGATGARFRGRARGDRNGARLRAELAAAARELAIRALVLEEHDHAVRLAAELEAHRDLRHRRIARVGAVLVDVARAVRATDADAALADRGEERIAVRAAEEPRALTGFLEHGPG